VSRSVKDLRSVKGLQANKVTYHRMINAGRRYEIRDKELYYPQHNKQFEHHVCIGSSCPLSLKQVNKGAQIGAVYAVSLCQN